MSNKEPIVHFEGKDMPASEFLDLMTDSVWNEPGESSVSIKVVKLKNGRQVAHQFYDLQSTGLPTNRVCASQVQRPPGMVYRARHAPLALLQPS
jgi:hypothetical protein